MVISLSWCAGSCLCLADRRPSFNRRIHAILQVGKRRLCLFGGGAHAALVITQIEPRKAQSTPHVFQDGGGQARQFSH